MGVKGGWRCHKGDCPVSNLASKLPRAHQHPLMSYPPPWSQLPPQSQKSRSHTLCVYLSVDRSALSGAVFVCVMNLARGSSGSFHGYQ